MSQAADDQDAIDLILEDHRRVDQLFDRFTALNGDDLEAQSELVREITVELSIHAWIEEEHLYPAVRKHLPEGETLVEESLDEHQGVKDLLAAIEDTDPLDPKFDERVTMLIREVRHHVEEEETQILPALRQRLDGDVLAELGRTLEAAKETAPTSPRPDD